MRRSGEHTKSSPSPKPHNTSVNLKRLNDVNIKERGQFFDSLGKSLGIESYEGWYHISSDEINANGSILEELREIYPKHDWKPWLFQRSVPHEFWNMKKNRLEYMNWFQTC